MSIKDVALVALALLVVGAWVAIFTLDGDVRRHDAELRRARDAEIRALERPPPPVVLYVVDVAPDGPMPEDWRIKPQNLPTTPKEEK